jgi:hypothetical protein
VTTQHQMFGNLRIILICLFLLSCIHTVNAQKDTAVISPSSVSFSGKAIKANTDTAKKYNPNIAIRRSAILPGWGQVTNKKYWKLPLVYGALGVTGAIFFHNVKQYKEAKNAYILATDNDLTNDEQIKQPYYSVKDQPERIRTFRNEVRQNVDYSVLFFIVFWGLNVADAAVDAHLKTFDVSDNLAFRIKAGYSPLANTNGVSLVLSIR